MSAVVVAAGDVAILAKPAAVIDTTAETLAQRPSLPMQEPLIEALDLDQVQAAIRRGVAQLSAEEAAEAVPVFDLPADELRGALEALLLVATKPLKPEALVKCLPGIDAAYLEGFLRGMADRWAAEQRGWDICRRAGGWQLLTRAAYHPWVRRLSKKELPTRLGKSALETLAIVAYKQPITRGQIEDIRGVQCGPMLRQLMDLKLVVVHGRDETLLGRPLLYGTSEEFLERFGLGSPDDLPRGHEFGA